MSDKSTTTENKSMETTIKMVAEQVVASVDRKDVITLAETDYEEITKLIVGAEML